LLIVIGELWYLWIGFHLIENRFVKNLFQRKTVFNLPWLYEIEWQAVISWLLLAGGIYFFVLKPQEISILDIKFSTPYERWEIAALAWNIVFATASFAAMPMPEGKAMLEGKEGTRFKIALLFNVLGGGLCTVMAILKKDDHSDHLAWVLCIALCYLITDGMIVADLPADSEKRRRWLETIFFADLPTVGALGALLVFLKVHAGEPNVGFFVSGAIAFQFIASSLVFAFIESRLSEVLAGARPGQLARDFPPGRGELPSMPRHESTDESSITRIAVLIEETAKVKTTVCYEESDTSIQFSEESRLDVNTEQKQQQCEQP
jgi:hypothetical protein